MKGSAGLERNFFHTSASRLEDKNTDTAVRETGDRYGPHSPVTPSQISTIRFIHEIVLSIRKKGGILLKK